MYNINRRKFLGYFGCGCCSLILPSCSTVPITERKQLSIIPESRINQQAEAAYEKFRSKAKLITKGTQLSEVRSIGKKMEVALLRATELEAICKYGASSSQYDDSPASNDLFR